MSDDARRGYTMLARLFLIVGGAFALLALVQMAGWFRPFNGNPLGVALIVLIIGVALEWTVRTAPPPAPEDAVDGASVRVGSRGEETASEGVDEDEDLERREEP